MFSTDTYEEEFDRFKQNEMFGTEDPIDLKNEEGLQLLLESDSKIFPCKINEDDEVINVLGLSEQEMEELSSEISVWSKVRFSHNIPLPRLYKATRDNLAFNNILMQLIDAREIEMILLLNNKIKIIPNSKKEYLIQIEVFWSMLPCFVRWLKDNTKLNALKI